MKKLNKKMVALFTTIAMFASLSGCGNKNTATTDLVVETLNHAETAELESEIVEDESNANIPYIEKNGLSFCDNTSVETTGVLCIADKTDDADIINVTFVLDDITVTKEGGKQTIIITQHTDGYIWGNGNDVFKTNLMLPSSKLYDSSTGILIPASEENDSKETIVELDGHEYTITNIETHEWKNDDWSNWVEDANGGERLASTLYVTNKITVDNTDYDGLVLLLQPITSFSGSLDGKYIADVWDDDCYLFHISSMAETFELARAEVESTETEEADEAETSDVDDTPVVAKEKTQTKPKNEKPASSSHKHSYTSVVAANATCSSTGTKTYTCKECGDSYTEAIGKTAHDFSVPITQTVWHDEVWTTVPKTITVKYIFCHKCKKNFYSNEEFQQHGIDDLNSLPEDASMYDIINSCASSSYDVCTETETVYDRVKVSDGYFEEVITGYKCALCGTQK